MTRCRAQCAAGGLVRGDGDGTSRWTGNHVAARKPEILVESGKAPLEAFVPQTHQPGHEAEVDFGDVTIRLAGELVTCYLFSFRLSYSGKAVHRVFTSCGQEAEPTRPNGASGRG